MTQEKQKEFTPEETPMAKLRNALTPLYGLANIVLADVPRTAMIIEAKKALESQHIIDGLLMQIDEYCHREKVKDIINLLEDCRYPILHIHEGNPYENKLLSRIDKAIKELKSKLTEDKK